MHEGPGVGVSGRCDSGDGVVGMGRRGVVGMSADYQGVYGHSGTNAGVVGESDQMHAVFAITHSPTSAGSTPPTPPAGRLLCSKVAPRSGASARSRATRGDRRSGAGRRDVAEQFDVSPGAEVGPGSVVVLDRDGRLIPPPSRTTAEWSASSPEPATGCRRWSWTDRSTRRAGPVGSRSR